MRPGEQHSHRSAADTAQPPNVHVQSDPFDSATIDGLRIKNATQFGAVPDVGDEAYLRANKPARSFEFAEL